MFKDDKLENRQVDIEVDEEEVDILSSDDSSSSPIVPPVSKPVILIVDNFEDDDPKLPTGPRLVNTPLPAKGRPPCLLRNNPKENFDDIRAMFEKLRSKVHC